MITGTVPNADTPPCFTTGMSTTSTTVICTIRMAIIATTTARSPWPDARARRNSDRGFIRSRAMPRPAAPASAAEDWPRILRRHGLRSTSATLGVLDILHRASAPMTHEEILATYAGRIGPPPDRVTLDRILDRLTEATLCDSFLGADRRHRFARHASGSGHVFECSNCHRVLPLPEDPELPAALARLGKALRRKGIRTQETAVTLRGVCADCGRRVPEEGR